MRDSLRRAGDFAFAVVGVPVIAAITAWVEWQDTRRNTPKGGRRG